VPSSAECKWSAAVRVLRGVRRCWVGAGLRTPRPTPGGLRGAVRRTPFGPALACLLGWLGLPAIGLAQWVTQTIPLERGWNAVHLRVQPSPSGCDEVFAGLPVATVSRYNARVISSQFGTDPTQLWKRPEEWLTWSKPDGESGYVRTLDHLVGGVAYLIQTSNACTLALKGQPVVPRIEWIPGQANLVGFHVSPYPELRPTIAEFFRNEPAIDGDPRLDQRLVLQVGPNLEPINLTGQTTRRQIEPGRAYWIQAQRLSDYVGPLRVATVNPAGLVFGEAVNELTLQLRHVSDTNAAPLIVTMRHVDSEAPPPGTAPLAGSVPLLYADRTGPDLAWRAWPTAQSQKWALAAGEVLTIRMAVNRGVMSAPNPAGALWQSLLEVTGSSGTFVQVPVSAGYAGGGDQLAPFPYGLWVGEAQINEASCARFDAGLEAEATSGPLPTGGSFPLRLIVHAGADGDCRLLSSVVIAAMPDARTNMVNRLYSEPERVPAGATVLARISSAALGKIRPVGLSGPGFLKDLQGGYTVDYDAPLNPFKHLYHPDHDNRGASGAKLPEGEESFTVSNRVQLTWNTLPDPALGATLWRPDETVTGTYQHEIGNLRHTPITVRGPFTLKRVSRVGRLD